MSVINLNDTVPAAPAGKVNIKWQADAGVAPRNVSAYIDSPSCVSEVPAGTMNGVNKVFTLSFAPLLTAMLILELNGVIQNPGSGSLHTGADFTLSGLTITYLVAPKASDSHHIWYSH